MHYVIYHQGDYESKAAFNTLKEAQAQANHDHKQGFAIPLRIEDEDGNVIHEYGDS